MRLTKATIIAGLPATVARDLMRHLQTDQPEGNISYWTTDPRPGSEIAVALADAGFVEARKVDDGETWWRTTTAGNALALASFRKPITRATADRHLGGVVTRAHAYNQDVTHLHYITKLTVFGSYLDPEAEYLGDLDIAVLLTNRTEDPEFLEYARASSQQFSSFIAELLWSRVEVLRILKNRSSAISITEEDVTTLADRWRVVYRIDGANNRSTSATPQSS